MGFFLLIVGIILIGLFFASLKSKKERPLDSNATSHTIQFSVQTSPPPYRSPEEIKEWNELEKKYPKWYGQGKTSGQCYKTKRIDPLTNGKTEHVPYKTDRYAELFGRGKDNSYFPGYGKICNRIFDVWYQSFNSKEKSGFIEYQDIGCEREPPFFSEDITNGINIYNALERTKGYKRLFNVRDEKNRRTWYAGLKHVEFTGLTTGPEDSKFEEY